MWYNKSRPIPIKPPNRAQRITIRIMIVVGVMAMGFFFWEVTKEEYIGYKPLYYPLLFSLFYIGLRLLYEWYHYWDLSAPESIELRQEFKVDIFTTYVPGEPYDMLIQTLEAIQAISYPHTTYLCDEGDDPYLKEQCERLGIVHVYRGPVKTNAKAGNINHAIYNHAQGDICLILDPDHVPAPDFLDWVLPHFQDPEIGFVQVVQAYDNIYENLIAKASAQQTFQFYGPIMMSMNSYGTAQAIGANCTFRREALDSIGGHAPGLAEDMHTSMKLHAKGWKSSYVPRVLTRGLVPNTLSAYYQQQLKWSRGVFELLVTTYPKIFNSLSWRQRFHYGLLPWHYFMGFLFLINFLVPIISLFTAHIPMQVGLAYFLSYAAPLLTSIIIIRHYVQKWVMEEDERGFHIQGGLIAIGTWWIHCLGFIYTVLRRKVPYNPTPKDGQEENTLGLNIPNLLMGLTTVIAIVYGLSRDLNPYSIIMAGFACLNFLFIGFIFFASMQNRWRKYKVGVPWLEQLFIGIWRLKDWFWKLRHGSYRFLRIVALPVAILAGIFIYVTTSDRGITQQRFSLKAAKPTLHFIGNADLEEESDLWYQSLSFFNDTAVSKEFLNQALNAGKYPYVEWHFRTDSSGEAQLIKDFINGKFNSQLDFWIRQFQTSRFPIYLAPFANLNDSSQLKSHPDLWQYLNTYFNAADINNIMLVYHCPPAELLRYSLPELRMLSFLELDGDEVLNSTDPENALASFLVQESFQFGTPWFLSFSRHVPSSLLPFIDSLAAANPSFAGLLLKSKDLAVDQKAFSSFGQNSFPPPMELSYFPSTLNKSRASGVSKHSGLACNYYKGLEWQNTRHPLFRRVIEKDFQEMKDLGIGHIYRYGPSIYNDNILKEAEIQDFGISYSFYIGDLKNFDADNPALVAREKLILNEVKSKLDEESIKDWHLGGSIYGKLDQYFYPPQLSYQRQLLLKWLGSLTEKIKTLDPNRAISLELEYNINVAREAATLYNALEDIDAIGIDISTNPPDALRLKAQMASCKRPLFIKAAGPELGAELAKEGYYVSFSAWQDDIFESHVSLNGLKNLDGYKKEGFAVLEKGLQKPKMPAPLQLEGFKVIPTARAVFAGQSQTFTCLIKANEKWRVLPADSLQVDWYLVRINEDGVPVLINKLDQSGPYIPLTLPSNPDQYLLVAYLIEEGYTMVAKTSLNTPLYLGPQLYTPTNEEIEFQRKKTL
ncbi:MAG: glycosyltransferase [Bacteroidetes bacterium]|nr:glycosyltransferase [Bacteroidota bacterium]